MYMERSEIFGGMEECHSCESGWTMYIGSPVQGGDDDDDDDDDGHSEADDNDAENGGHADANHEADSDDSMASDASSGPSHQGRLLGHGHGSTSTSYLKHDEDHHHHRHHENERGCYLDKKAAKISMENHQKLGLMKKKEDKQQVKEQQTTLKAKKSYHRSFSK